MYKTNTNKKSCTDVALTNPQQQEKEVTSTNERRKINTKRGKERNRESSKDYTSKVSFQAQLSDPKSVFLVVSETPEKSEKEL